MNKWKGGVISATVPATTGTAYFGTAHGRWDLSEQLQTIKSGSWAGAYTTPGIPSISAVTKGDTKVTVSVVAPSSTGGSPITGYTVTSSGGQTASGLGPNIEVIGLTNNTAYTFTVTCSNYYGTSLSSAPSASVIPSSVSFYVFTATSSTLYSSAFTTAGVWDSSLQKSWNTGKTQLYGVGYDPNLKTVAYTNYTAQPYLMAVPWNSSTGFGTKYADPATNAQYYSGSIGFRSNGTQLVSGGDVYSFSTNGFGTKQATSISNVVRMTLNSTGTVLFTGDMTNPYYHAYPISDSGIGTVYSNASNPAMADWGSGQMAINAADSAVIVRSNANIAPAIVVVRWTGTGWGTAYTLPTSPINNFYNGTAEGFAINDSVIYASEAAFAWNNSSGFGSMYTNTPGTGFRAMYQIPNENKILLANTASLALYDWNNGWGTAYANSPSGVSGCAYYDIKIGRY